MSLGRESNRQSSDRLQGNLLFNQVLSFRVSFAKISSFRAIDYFEKLVTQVLLKGVILRISCSNFFSPHNTIT